MNLTTKLFAPKTTDSVMMVFTKTLADLEDVSRVHNQAADQRQAEADRLLAEAEVARAEAIKADRTAKRLYRLVSDTTGEV